MTSGPPNIPVSTFQDVSFHNYKVVTWSHYYKNILASSKQGSAKHEAFKNNFELIQPEYDAKKAVIEDLDSKTLLYATETALIPRTENPSEKIMTDRLFALKMDDSAILMGALVLQKDSEFLQILNYYILRALESGDFKRLTRNFNSVLFTRENFEMTEPQPLGLNNVMFCFTIFAFGICISVIMMLMEFIRRKITTGTRLTNTNVLGDATR